MSHMKTLKREDIDPQELERLGTIVDQFNEGSPVAELLGLVLATVRDGGELAFGPLDCHVTTTEAARMLGMSRPHLTKLVDAGDIGADMVGSHRRVRIADVLEFLEQREAARAHLAETFGNVDEHRRALTRRMAGVDDETAQRVGG